MRIRSSHSSLAPRLGIVSEATQRTRAPIGELLQLAPETAAEVGRRQQETGRSFGETAVELGFASPEQVQRAIEDQHGFSVLEGGDERLHPFVVAAFDPEDPLARVARDLRAQITAATSAEGQSVRSVALVGIGVAEETTLLSANLAVACAQAGHSTLLIDANLDSPHQHSLFRRPNRLGLSTLLSGGYDLESVEQTTAIPALSLITAGPTVRNTSELFDRRRLARTMQGIEDRFGLVVIDAAQADRQGLAACDGIEAAILVARRHHTPTRVLQSAASHVRDRGSRIIGTVLVG